MDESSTGGARISAGKSASLTVAVLIPCFNEEHTVAAVVRDFRAALPDATIYVYDNNSTDRTSAAAVAAGALARNEPHQGKGNVVRRMFADVDADVYVLVDGDDTYEAAAAAEMIVRLVEERLDLVNGARRADEPGAYRRGHRWGNRLLTGLVGRLFGREFRDMLSGYKVLSRRFVKSFPAVSSGFEIETELAVHALELRMPCAELPTRYRDRPQGSNSKLHTFGDGLRIFLLILRLVKDEHPFRFFGLLAMMLAMLGLALGAPLVITYLETGLVPRLPTAVLVIGLAVTSVMTFFAGLVLEIIARTRRELKRLAYLGQRQIGLAPDAVRESRGTGSS